MTDWQPIETLPMEEDKTTGGMWSDWVPLWIPDKHGGFPIIGMHDGGAGWLGRDGERCCFNIPAPTHWQPFPEPPTEDE